MNSSPLIEAIHAADCRKSQASVLYDKVRILSYIADVKPGCDAAYLAQMRERGADDAACDAACNAEIDKLLKTHSSKFDDFNKKVRDQAKAVLSKRVSSSPKSPPAENAMPEGATMAEPEKKRPDTAMRGMTLVQLRKLVQTLKANPDFQYDTATGYDFEKLYMNKDVSFKESVDPQSAGPPDWFISVPFPTRVADTFRAASSGTLKRAAFQTRRCTSPGGHR